MLANRWSLLRTGACWRLLGVCNESSAGAGVPYESLEKKKVDAPSNVPAAADVVVIGGGSLGCNTLYHLAKLGMKNSVLLERDRLTSGTTWHTAGLLWNLKPSDVEVELIVYARHLMEDVLEAETGVNTGWINNGGMFTASTKERLDEYRRLQTIGRVYGVESHVLSPEEAKKIYPLLNVSDICGVLYSPRDGTIDPAGMCTALARGATAAGAKVIEMCSVTDIETTVDDFGIKKVTGVVTNAGTIKTNCVINCCGVWAPYIGKMAGVRVPQLAMKHAYIVTERIEGIQNMPNARDHDGSVYLKLQGDALSVGGYEPNPVFWDEVKNDFSFGLFDLDWDVFSAHVDVAVNRVPRIGEVGVKSTVCGPESFTADHKPLLGESPEVRGFFLGCGFNSGGMMMGPGWGRELAKWVIHGRPELDLFSYDIRRFTARLTDNSRWIRQRSHESYAKNYSIVFPRDEPLASRNMRKDALHQVLTDRGCIFQERHGYERPGWFAPNQVVHLRKYDYYGAYDNERHEKYLYRDLLEQEYTFDFPKHHDIIGKEAMTCRSSVSLFDMSYFGKFYLFGPDSQKAADWIFSNNMQKPSGSTTYTCMLNKAGGVEGDLTVSKIDSGAGSACDPEFEGDGFYIAAGGAAAQQTWCHINTAIQDQRFTCHLVDHTDDMIMLSIQGPRSREVLQPICDTELTNENFPFSTHKVVNVADCKVRAMRLSFVGELGWELHAPNEVATTVYSAVMKEAEKHGGCNAGYRAIDSLSIEKGYRHWHADLRFDDTPLEAGLAFTCKLKSDIPFLGREAVEKQKQAGLHKRIACFTIDEHTALNGLEAIWRNGKVVGYIRRADYAFTLGKSIGYGYVKNPDGGTVTLDYLRSGDYELESMGRRYKATLHTKSPFDPKNLRVQGIYE